MCREPENVMCVIFTDFCTTWDWPGAAKRVSLSVIDALGPAGVRVSLVTMGDEQSQEDDYAFLTVGVKRNIK